jgi:hypothetical protein
MKVCCGLDGDGHFIVAPLIERELVLVLLKNLRDGDTWENLQDEVFDEFGLESEEQIHQLSDLTWEGFVNSFESRGLMEILELL